MERLLASPEDHGRLTRQIDHAFLFSLRPVVGVERRARLIGYQPKTGN